MLPPIRLEIGNWIKNNAQKTERLATYLKNTLKSNARQEDGERWKKPVQPEKEFRLITPTEVMVALKENISSKKNLDYDLIPSMLLKKYST